MSVDPILVARFNAKWVRDETSGCHLWTASTTLSGYGQIKLPRQRRQIPAHRLSYLIHRGEIPDGLRVLHKCDNPLCVNPDHLFLGTQADNMADMVAKDRHLSGERSPLARLTEDGVRTIRSLAASGVSQKEIARQFGISPMQIGRIVLGTRWQHLLSPEEVEAVRSRKIEPRNKLSKQNVAEIKRMFAVGISQRRIAEFFGIVQGHVSRIVTGKQRV